MGRRAWITAGALLLTTVLVSAVVVLRPPREGRAPVSALRPGPGEPSLLIVTLDTTRADHLEPYGAERGATPNLALLAREGAVFERVSAVAPVTLPAHASIMTGLYPPQHGVRVNGSHGLPDSVRTLAERLQEVGFHTGAFVSSVVLDRRFHLDRGFALYDDRMVEPQRSREGARRSGELTVEAALRWLDALPAGEPFFLWVHLYDAHLPYGPPPAADPRFRARPYAAQIARLDSLVGVLLGHPRLGGNERLLLTVLADHGEGLWEHGEEEHMMLAYDATLRIPWILKGPGVSAGTRVDVMVSQVDLVPTLLELLGLPHDPTLPGMSLAPVLAGRRLPAISSRDLYAEAYPPLYMFGWSRLRVLRRGRWKYIESTSPELYDVEADPGESMDRIAAEPAKARELAEGLRQYVASLGGDARRAEAVTLDPETEARLASLGYLESGASASGDDAGRPNPRDVIGLRAAIGTAQRLLDKRQPEEAARNAREVLEHDKTNLAALRLLADSLAAQGQLDGAIEQAERLRALDPRNPARYLLLSELEEQRGNRHRASALVAEAMRVNPDSLEARVREAWLLRADGLGAEADEILRRALRSSPEDPWLNVVYAQDVELPLHDSEAGEARLLRVLERAPYRTDAWRLLGALREQAGHFVEAAQAYQSGLGKDPSDATLHASLGLLLARTGQEIEAEEHLREAIRLTADAPAALYSALGACLADRGLLAEAEAAYDKAIALDPKDPTARNNRALGWLRAGRLADARGEFAAIVAQLPAFAEAENNLAAVDIAEHQWVAAESHARRALRVEAESASAWNNLGVALDEQGKNQEAEAAYRKALENDPSYWQARLNVAVLRSKMGRTEESLAGLYEVLRQVPDQPEAQLQLAYVYSTLGQASQARGHFEAYLRTARPGPVTDDARRRLEALGGIAQP